MGGLNIYKSKKSYVTSYRSESKAVQQLFDCSSSLYFDDEHDLREYLNGTFSSVEIDQITSFFKEHDLYGWDLDLEE
jgi:hypothetical protein